MVTKMSRLVHIESDNRQTTQTNMPLILRPEGQLPATTLTVFEGFFQKMSTLYDQVYL